MCLRRSLLGLLLCGGCGPDVSVAAFDSAAALACETDVRDSGAVACDNPDYACSQPPACPGDGSPGDCGELGSGFDRYGCLRSACRTDADCGPGKICHRAPGDCRSSSIQCGDDVDGSCSCIGTSDCNGGRCLDACEYGFDPTECEKATTEAQCEALAVEPETGRACTWLEVEARTASCTDAGLRNLCVGLQLAQTPVNPGCPGDDPPAHYRLFGDTYQFLSMPRRRPVGWSTCGMSPPTDPPGCTCC